MLFDALVTMTVMLVTGSIVYCGLVLVAAGRYRSRKSGIPAVLPAFTVITPVAGAENGLEENLRSSFEQDYPEFELIFVARNAADPALDVVRKLVLAYPSVPARVVVSGEPPFANAKVYSLHCGIEQARHGLVAMKDSDVRTGTDMLRELAAEFAETAAGLITCPYRAVPHGGFWWQMDALGINTRFMGGVLVASMLREIDFTIGPLNAARKEALERIGGIYQFGTYLAEDFMLGHAARTHGSGLILSSYPIDHRLGGGDFRGNFAHRLRWARSTRCSRGWGYVGEFFTHPLPPACALVALDPHWAPLAAAAVLLRGLSAWVNSAPGSWRHLLVCAAG
ncbi:MAG: glycosyltransferase [Bryobacteraceae bacterium]